MVSSGDHGTYSGVFIGSYKRGGCLYRDSSYIEVSSDPYKEVVSH